MTIRIIGVAGLAIALAFAVADSAAAKKTSARSLPPPAPSASSGYAQSGPRMIQVRPGLWISNWDCVTDEGQGRFRPCNGGAKGD